MKPEVVIVVAASVNEVIGRNGEIPWQRIPADMKRFRDLTINHPVIMGRETYESLPENFCPLPNRLSLVLTTKAGYNHRGNSSAVMMPVVSLDAALYCVENKIPPVEGIDYSKVFICGGERVYQETLHLADRIELTRVYEIIADGDRHFRFNPQDWDRTTPDQKKGYCFVTYRRK